MSEHTPGPYHVFTKNWGLQIVSDEMPAEVLAVVNVDLVGGDAEANARLFASAPELLEAAKMTVAFLRDGGTEYPVWACEAAIAKAASSTQAKPESSEQ